MNDADNKSANGNVPWTVILAAFVVILLIPQIGHLVRHHNDYSGTWINTSAGIQYTYYCYGFGRRLKTSVFAPLSKDNKGQDCLICLSNDSLWIYRDSDKLAIRAPENREGYAWFFDGKILAEIRVRDEEFYPGEITRRAIPDTNYFSLSKLIERCASSKANATGE